MIENSKEIKKPKTALGADKTQFIITETFQGTRSFGEVIEKLIIAEAEKTRLIRKAIRLDFRRCCGIITVSEAHLFLQEEKTNGII